MSAAAALRTAACVTGLALILSACATLLPRLQAPRLSLNGITFLSGNLARQQLELSVHAVNPNERAIAVRRIDVHVQLNGAAFADGTTQAALALPPGGAIDFPLEVTTNLVNALPAVVAIRGHRAVQYRIYGAVKLQQSWLPALSFDQRGELQL